MPAVRSELTHAHRKIFKQYYELCRRPDEQQMLMLAALTERTAAEVQVWFTERQAEVQRKERLAQQQRAREEAEKKRAAAALKQPGGSAASTFVPPAQAAPAPPFVKTGSMASMSSASMASMKSMAGSASMAYGLTPEAQQQIKAAFDSEKMAGNGAYGQRDFDTAMLHYNRAIGVDPSNTTGQLHTIYSNISAVCASRLDWEKSYHYAWQAVYLRPQVIKRWRERMANTDPP